MCGLRCSWAFCFLSAGAGLAHWVGARDAFRFLALHLALIGVGAVLRLGRFSVFSAECSLCHCVFALCPLCLVPRG